MFKRDDRLTRAQQLFESGRVEESAWLLWEERRRAVSANEPVRLVEVDQMASAMRARLEHDERLPAFDAHLAGRESPTPDSFGAGEPVVAGDTKAVDVTPLSLGIVLAGAVLMLIAVFLPQFEANTFARIEKNSLIQNGDGWWFIGIAIGSAGAAYRAYRARLRSFGPIILGGIGIAVAFYYGTSHSQRRLCSVDAVTFGQHCTIAAPGIGIYAAGVGGLLILAGGWQIFRSQVVAVGDEPERGAVAGPTTPSVAPTIADRLRALDQLHADGVITDAEHAQRRAAVIGEV